jgi:hypothetical protein
MTVAETFASLNGASELIINVGGQTFGVRESEQTSPGIATITADAPSNDHTLIASLLVRKILRWEPETFELCFHGLRYGTTLDEFWIPVLTEHLRRQIVRLQKAEGSL